MFINRSNFVINLRLVAIFNVRSRDSAHSSRASVLDFQRETHTPALFSSLVFPDWRITLNQPRLFMHSKSRLVNANARSKKIVRIYRWRDFVNHASIHGAAAATARPGATGIPRDTREFIVLLRAPYISRKRRKTNAYRGIIHCSPPLPSDSVWLYIGNTSPIMLDNQ